MRKTFLISIVSSYLTLCLGVSAQGAYTYTTLDVPGASYTYAYGIDGGNIVGHYWDDGILGFSYDGSSYTTLDVPWGAYTEAYDIDGGNIVGRYSHTNGAHGFLATAVPLPAAAWMAVPLLAVIGVIGKMRREVQRQRH